MKNEINNNLTEYLSPLLIQPTAPTEEPPLTSGKEKRKRKLDEIVFGLSAAKEQKTFSDPLLSSPSSKKAQIPPSVSVTPASGPSMSSQSPASQKPFSVTVTSVPGSNTRKFENEKLFIKSKFSRGLTT